MEIRDCIVMIDGRNFFEWSIEGKDIKTFEGIRKIATSKGDDYTTGCLLNYAHFKEDGNRFN